MRNTIKSPSFRKWKPIPNTNRKYFCSKGGSVMGAPQLGNGFKWTVLTPFSNGSGYLQVKIIIKNEVKTCSVHRLVAFTYLKNPKNKSTINHKNGNKKKNNVSNLQWATRKENTQHAYDTGLKKSLAGESNGVSKITNKQAIEISKSILPLQELSIKYGLSHSCLSGIKTGRSWSKVTGIVYSPKKLSPETVLTIYKSPISRDIISKKYGVSEATICMIKNGGQWNNVTKHIAV